jgi:hypothetical protein
VHRRHRDGHADRHSAQIDQVAENSCTSWRLRRWPAGHGPAVATTLCVLTCRPPLAPVRLNRQRCFDECDRASRTAAGGPSICAAPDGSASHGVETRVLVVTPARSRVRWRERSAQRKSVPEPSCKSHGIRLATRANAGGTSPDTCLSWRAAPLRRSPAGQRSRSQGR